MRPVQIGRRIAMTEGPATCRAAAWPDIPGGPKRRGNSVAKGASRVRAVERELHRLGFRTAIVSRSGQRRGARAGSLAFDGDLIACSTGANAIAFRSDRIRPPVNVPHLVVEVGGLKKSVAQSLREMTAQPLPPGFRAIVVRLVDSKTRKPGAGWRWHLSSDDGFDSLDELLEAL